MGLEPIYQSLLRMSPSFLRLSNHHGAFTDCFSIPAFMSLFCSAHDSPDQARKERKWALNLLKDGTGDSYSYRMASRRHVPELLLTAFDALFIRQDFNKDDQECILLVESVEVLVKWRESSSFYHYFDAVGLTSWMQSSLNAIALNLDLKAPRVVRGLHTTYQQCDWLACKQVVTSNFHITRPSESEQN